MMLQLVCVLKLGIISRWKKQLELIYPDKTINWLLLHGFPGLPWLPALLESVWHLYAFLQF